LIDFIARHLDPAVCESLPQAGVDGVVVANGGAGHVKDD
jgi:hypothetical protein